MKCKSLFILQFLCLQLKFGCFNNIPSDNTVIYSNNHVLLHHLEEAFKAETFPLSLDFRYRKDTCAAKANQIILRENSCISISFSKELKKDLEKFDQDQCLLPSDLGYGDEPYEVGEMFNGLMFSTKVDELFEVKNSDSVEEAVMKLNTILGTFRNVKGDLMEEKKIANELEAALKNSERMEHTCIEVDSSELTDKDLFTNFIAKSQPLIIKNAASTGSALFKEFQINNLLKLLSKEIISVRAVEENKDGVGIFEGVEHEVLWRNAPKIDLPSYVREHLVSPDHVLVRPAIIEMQFEEFLQHLANGSNSIGHQNIFPNASLYIEYNEVTKGFDVLEKYMDLGTDDYLTFAWFLKDKEEFRNVWMSNGNTVGKIHFDPFENILTMIKGFKTFHLLPPKFSPILREGHIREARFVFNERGKPLRRQEFLKSTSIVNSVVDIMDLENSPWLTNEEKEEIRQGTVVCTVGPGDALFLPAFWWHEVLSEGMEEHIYGSNTTINLAINHWFTPFFRKVFPCSNCSLESNVSKYLDIIGRFLMN